MLQYTRVSCCQNGLVVGLVASSGANQEFPLDLIGTTVTTPGLTFAVSVDVIEHYLEYNSTGQATGYRDH
jgi:hypothetical protein